MTRLQASGPSPDAPQVSGGGAHRFAPVADRVFLFGRELGLRTLAIDEEDRVVPEPSFAAGRFGDPALLYAFESLQLPVGRCHGDDSPVARPPPLGGQSCELAQEKGVALNVAEPISAIASRKHPRPAVERVDFEAGVVGQGEAVARPRKLPSLKRRVLDVRTTRFRHFEVDTAVRRGDRFEAAAFEQATQLAHFAGVVGRQQEPLHRVEFRRSGRGSASTAIVSAGCFVGGERMRAMVLRGKDLTVEEVDTPVPGAGQVLARVRACGICGSDLHAARFMEEMIANSRRSGRTAWDTLDQAKGIVMGHEFVAEVVARGPGAEAWKPGTRVTSVPILVAPEAPNGFRSIGYSPETPGAYGEYVVLSAPLLLAVPDNVSDEVAATTEPCAVGLHAVREAHMQPGERAVVMGAGPIGLMTLLWLKKEGVAYVTISDPAPTRRALAARLGADLVIDPTHESATGRLAEVTGGAPPVVFECVGVPGTLEQAMELVDRNGRVIVVGVCMLEDRIHPMVGINKQLTLKFVLGYDAAEYAEALAAFADGTIDTSPMVTRKVTLDELPAAFAALADPKDCKVVVIPG